MDAVLTFLIDVLAFYLGRFYLLMLTLGRYKPNIGDRHAPLVSLVGGVVTVMWIVGIFSWWNGG